MATFEYGLQALGRAIHILAQDEGDLLVRVRKAAPDLLYLEPSVCPSSWRRDIRWIKSRLMSRRRQTFDGKLYYDFSAAVQYRVTAKKIADRVWNLSYKSRELDYREGVETGNVQICGMNANPIFQTECPECHSEILTKLKPSKNVRCSCGYRWHVTMLAVGTKPISGKRRKIAGISK